MSEHPKESCGLFGVFGHPQAAELAYLAVLAVLGMESGVPFHVQAAKDAGASREEVISAVLVGLPAAGHGVTQVLPAALAAYDAD